MKIIEVIVERCQGCHSCEIACALAHSKYNNLIEAIYGDERLYSRIILEIDGDDVIPMHCRHCTDAPCITVCPTAAMSRSGAKEPVVLNSDECIGCNACVKVCPFGIIKAEPGSQSLTKCDLCINRLKKGKIPACAEACPVKAIRFTSIKDLSADRRKEILNKFLVSLQQKEKMES